ncbi:hypothetical protein ElyMa_001795000 [Elysia marginata]|uniref:Uncharacterized protein n=1 Tax=Elysia marginata TaxID=1093978 RepID=A0AAV4EFQ1_9GAST|nr:hypothetical protein ElyMa_001795000 [Elysia marginata]
MMWNPQKHQRSKMRHKMSSHQRSKMQHFVSPKMRTSHQRSTCRRQKNKSGYSLDHRSSSSWTGAGLPGCVTATRRHLGSSTKEVGKWVCSAIRGKAQPHYME